MKAPHPYTLNTKPRTYLLDLCFPVEDGIVQGTVEGSVTTHASVLQAIPSSEEGL